MLTVTEQAAIALRSIRDRLPGRGGLRLTQATGRPGRFTAAIVDAPAAGDRVVENEGARVFLDAAAASVLADRILDARPHDQGVRFVLTARRPTTATSDPRPPNEGDHHADEPRPDFARGQRQRTERHAQVRPDFARGQREREQSVSEYGRRPDFARGQAHGSEMSPERRRRGSFATGMQAEGPSRLRS